jgi:hypothetical protein
MSAMSGAVGGEVLTVCTIGPSWAFAGDARLEPRAHQCPPEAEAHGQEER